MEETKLQRAGSHLTVYFQLRGGYKPSSGSSWNCKMNAWEAKPMWRGRK